MSDFERTGTAYDEQVKRRSAGTWFADLGDRLARGFSTVDRPTQRPQLEPPVWEEPYEEEADGDFSATDTVAAEPMKKRFPTAFPGYDRDAVDEHIAALEHELADVLADRSPAAAVDAEIARVGEETSAILRVAHEQAAEIVRRAQAQADRCVSDAADNAVAITADANRKLRQLDSETDVVWSERVRLIEDVRTVATSLFSLAEDACERFPEESERATSQISAVKASPAPVAPQPSPPRPVAASTAPSTEFETAEPEPEWTSEHEPE
jgi:cell division septum initiation protein DivIVA